MNKWRDICFNAMLEYIPEEFTTADTTERFRSIAAHIDTIGDYLYSETATNDDIAKFYSMAGLGYKDISNYEAALDYYFKAVSIRQKTSNVKALGLVYNNIAVLYGIKAMYKLALEYNLKSIEIAEMYHALPEDLIIAYNNLSVIYTRCADYNSALKWNNIAFETLESNALLGTPINADVLIMKASIYYVCEQFSEALKLDFEALDILKQHYPEVHADIGTAYNNIAREYFSLEQYKTALEYYLGAHEIYEKIYGADSSHTAEVCGNIAKTFMALNDYTNALEWCLTALEVQEITLGKEHPEVVLRHSFLSEIYEGLNLYEEAINHLLIIRNFYGANNQSYIVEIVNERINSLSEVGENCGMAGEHNE